MTRAQQANILFVGIILGMVVSQACGGGGGGTANAADDCTCTIDGPIEVTIDAAASQPLPVMICDGQETDGTCAKVYESNGGENRLSTSN
jgi:hypothetical protein